MINIRHDDGLLAQTGRSGAPLFKALAVQQVCQVIMVSVVPVFIPQPVQFFLGNGTEGLKQRGQHEEGNIENREPGHKGIVVIIRQERAARGGPEEKDEDQKHYRGKDSGTLPPEEQHAAGGKHRNPDHGKTVRVSGYNEEHKQDYDLDTEEKCRDGDFRLFSFSGKQAIDQAEDGKYSRRNGQRAFVRNDIQQCHDCRDHTEQRKNTDVLYFFSFFLIGQE